MTLWACVYHGLFWLQIAAGVLAGVLGFAIRIEGDPWWSESLKGVEGFVHWAQRSGHLLVAPAAAVVALAGLGRKILGPPWAWAAMKRVLNRWQERMMGGRNGDPHYHRVTLFRARRWTCLRPRWPWDRVLVPVLRSGHSAQRSSIWFRIPDDPDRCEGIAGIAFNHGDEVRVHDLPDLAKSDASDADFADYSKRTRVSLPALKARKPHARSFYAIPIEVRGEPWGAVVLDSREPKELCTRPSDSYEVQGYVLSLTVLLERRAG